MTQTLFVSYAHEDKPFCEQFSDHLSLFREIGLIQIWYDGELLGGDDWYEKIVEGLNSASIIVFLISSDFLRSDFVKKEEIPRALKRKQNGEATLIPVILRSCLWDLSELGSLQALPKDALPVDCWPNRDQAFENVARGILRVIQAMKEKPIVDSASESQSGLRVLEIDQRDPAKPLFGREQDLRNALDLLKTESFAITGIKGIGKSMFASAIFERAKEDAGFPFKTYYWRRFLTRRAPSFDLFARRLVKDIEDKDVPVDQMEPGERVKLVVKLIEKSKCLLVIDQFEEVMDDSGAVPKEGYEEYGELLRCAWEGFRDGRLIVTSWATPKVSGTIPFKHLPLTGIDSAAVSLMVNEEMKNTSGNPCDPIYNELIERVDGHPLALKLLARNYQFLGIMKVASRDSLINGQMRDVASRIVSETYNRISDDKTLKVLSAVSIFSGPSDLLGVSHVSGESLATAYGSLQALSEMALVTPLSVSTYQAHALVREHVLDNLISEEKVALHKKAAEFYLQTQLKHPDERNSISDIQPLLSAIHHLMAGGQYSEAGKLFLSEALHLQLYLWGYTRVLAELYEHFLRENLSHSMAGVFSGNLGLVRRDLGNLDEALDLCENSLRLGELVGDDRIQCAALINLGDIHYYRHEFDPQLKQELEKSLEYHRRAERLLSSMNNPYLDQKNCGCLGNVFWAMNDLLTAQGYFERARDLCTEICEKKCDTQWASEFGDFFWFEKDSRRCEGIWIGGLGNLCWAQGKYHDASKFYEEAIGIASEVGDRRHMSWWSGVLAGAYQILGELDKAKELLNKALDISREIHYARGIRQQSQALARICLTNDEINKAIDLYSESLTASRQMKDSESAKIYQDMLLNILSEQTEASDRDSLLEKVIQNCESIFDEPNDRSEFYGRMGATFRAKGGGYLAQGIHCYSLALKIHPTADLYQGRANCHADRGNLKKAIEDYSNAIKLDKHDVVSILSKMEVQIRSGNHDGAIASYEELPLDEMPQPYLLIAAYMISIALSLEGLDSHQYLMPFDDKTIDLKKTSWNFEDVEKYLKTLSPTDIPRKRVDNALEIHNLLKHYLE